MSHPDDPQAALSPAVAAALRDMQDPALPPDQRAAAGRRLAELGDPRPGVLAPDGVPDFVWCEVPAGKFRMGGDFNANEAWVGGTFDLPYTFWIAKYPVTYAQFEPFVAAGGYEERSYWTEGGWLNMGDRFTPRDWQDPDWHVANHPMIGVTFDEAVAYTRWLNTLNLQTPSLQDKTPYVLRLSRECEWEKAARAPDGREFPWGNEWDATRLNWGKSGIGRTNAVGMFPEGANPAHGACDLLGNTWEWCLTSSAVYSVPSAEANDPTVESARCVRGGAWNANYLCSLRAAARNAGFSTDLNNHLGFRIVCAPSV